MNKTTGDSISLVNERERENRAHLLRSQCDCKPIQSKTDYIRYHFRPHQCICQIDITIKSLLLNIFMIPSMTNIRLFFSRLHSQCSIHSDDFAIQQRILYNGLRKMSVFVWVTKPGRERNRGS